MIKTKQLAPLILVAVMAAIISLLVANALFSPPKRETKVPQVEAIDASFPDVKNNPAYQSFLNNNALDATQPIQIGNTSNSVPFQ